jgi:V/A-type H+-transporting ATPase subunit B
VVALSETDRRYLDYRTAIEQQLVHQQPTESRPLDRTLELAWQALAVLPRRELTMLPATLLRTYLNNKARLS